MAELSIAGLAVGLAMRGLRPVAEIQFADFHPPAADHLIGEAARSATHGRRLDLPDGAPDGLRRRLPGRPLSLPVGQAFYAHVPGLKVVAPSFPADAKGLLETSPAIRDSPDPVLFLEHKLTYRKRCRGRFPRRAP